MNKWGSKQKTSCCHQNAPYKGNCSLQTGLVMAKRELMLASKIWFICYSMKTRSSLKTPHLQETNGSFALYSLFLGKFLPFSQPWLCREEDVCFTLKWEALPVSPTGKTLCVPHVLLHWFWTYEKCYYYSLLSPTDISNVCWRKYMRKLIHFTFK